MYYKPFTCSLSADKTKRRTE